MAQPYSNPRNVSLTFTGISLAGGNVTKTIPIPSNVSGATVKNLLVMCTTSCVGTSAAGAVEAGVSGSLASQASVTLGTTSSPTQAGSSVSATDYKSGLTGRNPNSLPFTYMAGGTNLILTFVAPTGGSVAGVVDVLLDMDWFYSG